MEVVVLADSGSLGQSPTKDGRVCCDVAGGSANERGEEAILVGMEGEKLVVFGELGMGDGVTSEIPGCTR